LPPGRCSEDDTIGDLKKLVAAHAGAAALRAVRSLGRARVAVRACALWPLRGRGHGAFAYGLHALRPRAGTRPEKIRIQKWCVRRRQHSAPCACARSSRAPRRRYNVYKDHITLEDYEIHDGMGLELYYN
jgi:ubiquitin-like protein 5